MATTPNQCDICGELSTPMQGEAVVRTVYGAIVGTAPGETAPDICMRCWGNLRETFEKCWFPGHVAELTRMIGEEHDKRVEAEYVRLRDEYQRKAALCAALCDDLQATVAAQADELRELRGNE